MTNGQSWKQYHLEERTDEDIWRNSIQERIDWICLLDFEIV
jgi:hypothetical protein